jgi:hypothetical protein
MEKLMRLRLTGFGSENMKINQNSAAFGMAYRASNSSSPISAGFHPAYIPMPPFIKSKQGAALRAWRKR